MELSELQIGQWYKVLLKGHKIPYYYIPLSLSLPLYTNPARL